MANRDDGEAGQYRRLMKEALLELESLQAQLDRLRRAPSEPIAVVGLGCRFPAGANSPGEFWTLLADGVDAVGAIPPARWDVDAYYDPDVGAPGKVYCRNAALVDQAMVECFSPEFFGIAPREAQGMDPQQRMLLEVCWEALEDAAVPADRVRGSRTGLFVGSCTDDYLQLFNNLADPARIEGYSSLGTARCITAGRVSYYLGLEGPAIQLDTACSSSLVAVHQACGSLRSGECDMALAGGVNLQLSPVWTIGLCKLKALAPDGRCKTFDAAADGFGRGEGCGMLVLTRLSDALESGDPIRALILGSAVNHDGRSAGLTVPNQLAQEKLLRQALQAAKVRPEVLDYVEAHGTGTVLGDPIEMGALASVFRDREQPLWVGSVKTNIGHLEAAAGVAGLIKVILAMEHESIPPHLHFEQPNPHIAWNDFSVRIPTQPTPWVRGERLRLAGTSSFGFSGTNAHVILQEAPRRQEIAKPGRPCQLLVLSATSRQSLDALAARFRTRLANDPALPWSDVCFTAAVGRAHFAHRLAILAETSDRAWRRLEEAAQSSRGNGKLGDGVWFGEVEMAASSGQGWPGESDLEQTDWQMLLTQAAERYVQGLPVVWEVLYRGAGGRKLSLPTYPFQRERYWPQTLSSPASGRGGHALLGPRVFSAAAARSILYESRLAAGEPAYLADHCLGDTAVVPATALLEMALAAGRELAPSGGFAVDDVVFERVLALPEGAACVVQTVLNPHDAGHRIEVFSRDPTTENQTTPEWTRHTSGNIVPVNAPCSPVSLDELRRLCAEEVPVEAIYDRIARQGLRYGPSFRLLRQVWRGDGRALGRVAVPEDPPLDMEGYWFHPAVLDACLQVIAAMRETDLPHTIVPVCVERWEVFGRPGLGLWSHATLQTTGELGQAAEFTANIDTIDTEGLRIARLTGLRLRQVEASALLVRTESKPGSDLIPPPGAVQLHASWRQLLDQSPSGNRLRLLVSLLRAEVATVLGWDSADRVGAKQNLFEVGMDSMTSLELQVRLQKNLGCSLPLSLAFDYPNVQALATYITERLFPAAEGATGDNHPEGTSEGAQRLAAMSDQEVQALLSEKYKHLLESAPDRRGSGPD